jgi:hypothetical protein
MYKALDKWLFPWLRSLGRREAAPEGLKHLVFCVADHFEPFRENSGGRGQGSGVSEEAAGRPTPKAALADVKAWTKRYRAALGEFRDADGEPPCQTFFYPAEDYDEACLTHLSEFCEAGLGEVEIQLHHRNDTAAGFKKKIATFKEQLRRLGFLGHDADGKRKFGFVHGNWALCNSRPDGDWCGVNDELDLLRELGCYADFTFPSAPSPTQPRMVNSIYRAEGSAEAPRGHDSGKPISVGDTSASGLMLVTGPLALRFDGLRPRLENSALTGVNAPTAARVDSWVKANITAVGRPEWVFVKVHMHGCNELDSTLLEKDLPEMHRYLGERYNDGKEWALHYVSAREMYNIVRAAEAGKSGNCAEWRDFEVKR